MRFRVLAKRHFHRGYQWMPKSSLEADIFFQKVCRVVEKDGHLACEASNDASLQVNRFDRKGEL
jgi:hypothetical protein